jgi:hypothetical protein
LTDNGFGFLVLLTVVEVARYFGSISGQAYLTLTKNVQDADNSTVVSRVGAPNQIRNSSEVLSQWIPVILAIRKRISAYATKRMSGGETIEYCT